MALAHRNLLTNKNWNRTKPLPAESASGHDLEVCVVHGPVILQETILKRDIENLQTGDKISV